jgi:hypothetical protein
MTQILSPSMRRRTERARVQRLCAVAALAFTILLILPSIRLTLSRNEKNDQTVTSSASHRQLQENNGTNEITDTTSSILDADFLIEPDLRKKDGTKKQQKLRKRRLLPSFDNGGVIIFFNIAASGGLAIRQFVQNQQNLNNDITADDDSQSDNFNIRTERMYNPETAVQFENEIVKELTNKPNDETNKTILFVEISGDVPGFVYWQKKLDRFRELAIAKSFFSFTLVREPVSYHTSYFNTYQLAPCVDNVSEDYLCEQTLVQPSDMTENVLIDRSIPNHQCLWLARLSHNPYNQESCVTDEECRGTYSYMRDHLDWIGTTEEIQTVTIPLLSYMISSKENEPGKQTNPVTIGLVKAGQLEVRDISESTTTTLLERSAGDAEVYTAVKRDYDITNFFHNYDPKKNLLAQS